MSTETRQAAQDAIAAHIADETEGASIATHWAAVVGLPDVRDPATNAVFTLKPGGQPSYITLGLCEVGASIARAGWGSSDDEEDE